MESIMPQGEEETYPKHVWSHASTTPKIDKPAFNPCGWCAINAHNGLDCSSHAHLCSHKKTTPNGVVKKRRTFITSLQQ
jgi:hypothetical protein